MRWILALLVFLITLQLVGQDLLGVGLNGNDADVRFGTSVALSGNGNRMFVGARQPNTIGYGRVYEWNGNFWVPLGGLINGEETWDYCGVSVDISENGNRIAIGSALHDVNGTDSGKARIFQWNGFNNWVQMGDDIVGESESDQCGWSVSFSQNGNKVAVGSPGNDENGLDAGHVRVFEWTGNNWTQIGNNIVGEAVHHLCGLSVAFSENGNKLAIGSPTPNGPPKPGSVRVFEWDGMDWVQVGNKLVGSTNDDFGWDVSIASDGLTLAIGAPNNYDNGFVSGQVQVYKLINNSWTQLGSNINGEAASDDFGNSLSLSADGSKLVAGAWRNDGNGNRAGHSRIFQWNSNAWSQIGIDIDGDNAEDWSGYDVAISDDGLRIAIGAPGDDNNGNINAGQVKAYSITSILPVTLSHFEGFLQNEQVHLHWTTTSETNNQGFYIQRSSDGKSWQSIGFVAGQGTTISPSHYEYLDPQPQKSITYYRLQQMDFDGAVDYSNIVAIALEGSAKEVAMQVYPNPTRGTLTLSMDNPSQQPLQMTIHNSLGQLVWQSTTTAITPFYQENLLLEKPGLYYVTVKIGQQIFYERVVVER